MTVTQRILIHVTLGTAAVIAIVAAVTYGFVFRAAEDRTLEHLRTYVAQRTRQQETDLRIIHGNMEIVKSLYLKRVAEPMDPDTDEQWGLRVMRYPDGAWRSRMEFADPRRNATVWTREEMDMSRESRHRMLTAQRVAEELMPAWIDTFPSLYIMFPGAACVGFNPLQPTWEWDTPADYPLEQQEWYYAATPGFNLSRGIVWTGVYRAPISGIPYASVLQPVEENGISYCIAGHDVPLDSLLEKWTRSEFPDALHMIFQGDGRLIAHPKLEKEILASDGALRVQDLENPELAEILNVIAERGGSRVAGIDSSTDHYYAASQLPVARWLFVTVLPRTAVRDQALESSRWVWISGLASLALLVGFLGAILNREVGKPLAELTSVTEAMIADDTSARATPRRKDDFGKLAASFNKMADRVQRRETDLRRIAQDLEDRVAARTEDLNQALIRERELGEVKSNFVSLVSHEFRTPLGVILSAAEVLDRYFEQLPEEKRARHLEMISRSTLNLASLIDQVLLVGSVEEGRLRFKPTPLDLQILLRTLCDEVYSATGGTNPIELRTHSTLEGAVCDEALLRHIVGNLLSNAVKYSERGELVLLDAERAGIDLVLKISDRGIGIPEEDQPKLFSSFTRGSNVGTRKGTGLGLVIVQRCVQLHGGTVGLASSTGEGTTVTVTLPVFEA